MPDDRVSIHEVPAENVGHTPLLDVTGCESWAVQSEPARIFVEVCAPPGLLIEAKRKMVRALTEVAGSNGFLQTENPDTAPFAATVRRK